MNLILNVLFLGVCCAFVLAFIYSFVLNLIRANKVKKEMAIACDYVVGTVTEVAKVKGGVCVRVGYVSKSNNIKFEEIFELSNKEFNDQYYVGQEVKIFYPDVKNSKKVVCFPVYLEGQKITMEKAPIISDCLLMAGNIYIFVMVLLLLLKADPVTNVNGLVWNGRPLLSFLSFSTLPEGMTGCFDNQIIILLFVVFYFVFIISYLIERIKGMSNPQKLVYLKLCGLKGTAEVKTFKLGKKNAAGVKESQMKIEYYTNDGVKVNCDLNSCLYTETQEQFIELLYDEKNPTNVVYVRK